MIVSVMFGAWVMCWFKLLSHLKPTRRCLFTDDRVSRCCHCCDTLQFRGMLVNQTLYNCVFDGEITEGRDLAEVKATLCRLFKAEPRRIDALFARAPVVIKRSVDRETALRYKAAFERVGATLRSVPLDADTFEDPDNGPSKHAVGFGWLSRFLERTESYSDLRLVVVLTLVPFPLTMLLAVPLALLGVEAPDQGLGVSGGTLLSIALLAPIIETLLGQWLPMKIASYFTVRPAVLVAISAVLFSAAHGSFSLAASVFPSGLALAWIFFIKKSESFKKAFWLTASSHALHNFIVFGLMCLGVSIDG